MDFTVLVVDDEENFREGIKQYLSRDVNYEILDAASLSEAREILNRQPVDIIMLDVQIGKEYGPDLLYDINSLRCRTNSINVIKKIRPVFLADLNIQHDDIDRLTVKNFASFA